MAIGVKNGVSNSVQFQTLNAPRTSVVTPSPPVMSSEKLRDSCRRGM